MHAQFVSSQAAHPTRRLLQPHETYALVAHHAIVTIQYPMKIRQKIAPQYFSEKILDDYIRRGGL